MMEGIFPMSGESRGGGRLLAQTGMPQDEAPGLYRRIRYDSGLEAAAFARLAELDLEGCRAAFGKLVDQLDFSSLGPRQREVVLLLLGVLLQVNSRVQRVTTDGPGHHASRVALIERFAGYHDPEDARQGFIPALNRMLSPLRSIAHHGQHPSVVARALGYIEENYSRRISLSSVAAQLHVSANYLSRLFHQETGTTLTAWIHRLRLEHARLLLAAGERSISEIAYLVGYQNYRDFYRNFVKYEKASPRQARRKLSGKGAPSGGDARPGDLA